MGRKDEGGGSFAVDQHLDFVDRGQVGGQEPDMKRCLAVSQRGGVARSEALIFRDQFHGKKRPGGHDGATVSDGSYESFRKVWIGKVFPPCDIGTTGSNTRGVIEGAAAECGGKAVSFIQGGDPVKDPVIPSGHRFSFHEGFQVLQIQGVHARRDFKGLIAGNGDQEEALLVRIPGTDPGELTHVFGSLRHAAVLPARNMAYGENILMGGGVTASGGKSDSRTSLQAIANVQTIQFGLKCSAIIVVG